MRKLLRVFVLGFCLSGFLVAASVPCLAAAPASAGESAASPSESHHELIFEIINFILLAGLLAYLYRNRGRAFFDERSDTIRKSLDEGRQALESSMAQLAAAEGKLAHFEEEVAALKAQAESEVARERERTRQATSEEVQRIQDVAKVQIEAATNAAKQELKTFVVEQAFSQAGGMIRERLDDETRRKLVGFFLADLESRMSKN